MVEDKAVGAFHYLIEWMDAFSAALTTIIIIGSAITARSVVVVLPLPLLLLHVPVPMSDASHMPLRADLIE